MAENQHVSGAGMLDFVMYIDWVERLLAMNRKPHEDELSLLHLPPSPSQAKWD
jgi:hypothetical protein